MKTQLLVELVMAFSNQRLDAYVLPPNSAQNLVIPSRYWAITSFPERIFLAEILGDEHGDEWSLFVGRTPFVENTQFDEWLEAQIVRRADPEASRSAANQALVDYLLGLAMDGLSPAREVEEFAGQWDLPALASSPPLERCNPLDMPNWTLCMVVSWILWRKLEIVREQIDGFRSDCWRWVSCHRTVITEDGSCTVIGAELVSLGPRNLALLALGATPDIVSINDASAHLWRLLGEKALQATAVCTAGDVVEIPAREWAYLESIGPEQRTDHLVFSHDRSTRVYSHITLPSLAVRDLWPAPDDDELLDEPLASVSQILRTRLAFAIANDEVIFADGPVLSGTPSELFMALADQFKVDRDAGVQHGDYGYVRTQLLEKQFDLTGQELRQRVKRLRASLKKQFMTYGHSISKTAVVQNMPWKGYRLNPDLVVVHANQIDQPSRILNGSVTTPQGIAGK